ncbi:hypothetical protein FGG08_001068 [Glutinoglossum americanum]|uniref:WD40 repeat-like protein n=1 Tax=Glutinoglossum americanum TaxID=1670608 RepID=A0A9P8I7T2_9PEZI|nr:hypothetical protein FGG08_001068 [Glutinoglossum americanum]
MSFLGYGEAAVRLQRDWNLDPQSLPFASHVRAQALVSLVQKGLLYHELEQTVDQARHTDLEKITYGNPTVTTEASYFFGPDAAFSDKAPDCHFEQRAESLTTARSRHLRETAANGLASSEDGVQPPAKKSRKNGIENGDAMEIDQNGHGPGLGPGLGTANMTTTTMNARNARTASPQRRATTNGQSVAIQVDKVTELGRSETEFISPGSAVLSCVWNPVDPTALALKTEALCQIWSVTRNHQPHSPLPMDDDSLMSDITTTAWSPKGEYLATGSFDGHVAIWTVRGALVRRMHPIGQGAIFRLRWNDDGSYLLGLTGDGERLTIVVWNTKTGFALNNIRKVPIRALFYVVWTGHSDFVIGGYQTLQKYEVRNDDGLPFGIFGDEAIVLAKSDGGGLLATSSESGYVKLWDSTNRGLLNVIAHPSHLICMEWQPLAHSRQALDKSSVRILATGSEDGIVRLWNGRAPGGVPLHRFELGSPIHALAFSPDGFFIAAASFGKVMIWNAEGGGLPRAFWTAKSATDQRRGVSNMIKQDPGHEDSSWVGTSPNSGEWPDEQLADLSLSWDADGKRLACGVGKQVAIIKFG